MDISIIQGTDSWMSMTAHDQRGVLPVGPSHSVDEGETGVGLYHHEGV